MDSDTTIAVAVAAAPGIGAIVWGLVRWSFTRNVEHEDQKQERVETKQERFERELQEMRTEHATSMHKAELTAHDARTQLTALAGMLGELKGALNGLRDSFEQGREKQALFYRGELAKVEADFRQQVSKLELKLEAQRPRSKT